MRHFCFFVFVTVFLGDAFAQRESSFSERDRRVGLAPKFHIINGLSQDLSTVYRTIPPRVDRRRPFTDLAGIPGRVRGDRQRILVPLSRPMGSPPSLFGGLVLIDPKTSRPIQHKTLHGWAHNPIDIATLDQGPYVLSNQLAFDSANLDYRLTFVDAPTLNPLLTLPIPNPHSAMLDPSLSPSGLLKYDRWLFICCTGFSYRTFEYVNSGTVAVFDLVAGQYVDTDSDPSNGITPLVTHLPNPNLAEIGPDGELYVLCSSNYGVFTGGAHVSGGVEVFSIPSFDHKATLDFLGDSAPASLSFTPDGRGYCGDSVIAWVYSFDFQTDSVLRDALVDPIQLPQSQGLGWVIDIQLQDDGSVLALEFNGEMIYRWWLSADTNSGNPPIDTYADLNPLNLSFAGPMAMIQSL